MESIIGVREQTLDEKLSEAFGIISIYPQEDVVAFFGICPQTEILNSIRSGYLAAQKGEKLNLWQIRNRGYELREKLNWSISNTEAWIEEHQGLYEKGFDFFYESQGKFSPRFPGSPLVEYVKPVK